MTRVERVHAELDILGLDVTDHVLTPYADLLAALGTAQAVDLRGLRSRKELLVAGVKVATQTPPIRSGRRVVFLTLDDSTGPVDATFFEDVQGPYAATVFHSWLLLVQGVLRRTGPRGVSLRATGAWELSGLWQPWLAGGIEEVHAVLARAQHQAWERSATMDPASRSRHLHTEYGGPARIASGSAAGRDHRPEEADRAGGMGGGSRRVLVHPSGFRQSPYADVRPPGEDARAGRGLAGLAEPGATASDAPPAPLEAPPRKLWHASPGSSGQ